MDKKKVLFVCLGNICRSPAAEGAFRKEVAKRNLSEQFIIDSAGTAAYHVGEFPHSMTRKVASEHGISLTHHARQFSITDFRNFDYILAMDQTNYSDIISLAQDIEDRKKVFLFREFDPLAGKERDVPDPYFSGKKEGFEEVHSIVSRTSERLLDWMLQL
jgi:protein-tyrosine phosphatase